MILVSLFFVLFVFLFSSFHAMVLLIFVEFITLFIFFYFCFSLSSWSCAIFFLFVSVCLGAYGVSFIINLSRSLGGFFSSSYNF